MMARFESGHPDHQRIARAIRPLVTRQPATRVSNLAGWGILTALGLVYGLLWKGPKR